ncbi:PepSY domain-containing protein [Streptomyces sp. JH14]|uniref:PepSY domain-containing protein n=1 Tax=Streptomyces sp. JH14 TaxID=2793630 RepID=UPI0023F7AC60|nr:PepSY domain-containing protein [Streptomyces sp. JH14]MDF6044924.1 PepSY domain-containing protein [Streptomyces sp. JH14]
MKRSIAIAAVTAAVLVGGGTVTAVAFADGSGRSSHEISHGNSRGSSHGEVRGSNVSRVGVKDAVAAAVKAVPGTVTEARLDDRNGRNVWQLDAYGSDRVRYDVTVDADTAKVLGRHTSDDRGRRTPPSAPVTLSAAVDAALRTEAGTVTSIELDDADRNGRALHWEVDVRDANGMHHELNVDARTARVTADDPGDGRNGDDSRNRTAPQGDDRPGDDRRHGSHADDSQADDRGTNSPHADDSQADDRNNSSHGDDRPGDDRHHDSHDDD